MDRLDEMLTTIDCALNTRRKRHLAGGILMSISLLFGGIAITIFTTKTLDDDFISEELLERRNSYD